MAAWLCCIYRVSEQAGPFATASRPDHGPKPVRLIASVSHAVHGAVEGERAGTGIRKKLRNAFFSPGVFSAVQVIALWKRLECERRWRQP